MEAFLIFLGKNEVIVYLLLILIGLFVFRRLWIAWREWQQAYFSLEREIAMRRLAQAIVVALILLLLACSQFAIATFIVPGLPASVLVATPTIDLLATPGTGLPGAATTLLPATVAPAAGSEGCIPGKLEIASPKSGDSVTGLVEIKGTVEVSNFGFYKYEFAAVGSDLWATISADSKPKKDETLGTWFTGALTPGQYQLRLVVTDTQGQTLPPCIISVQVVGP